ncbi:Anoctamin-10 [Larimichthys crocea]|uniref:Uncharacterized protein n=1 Tax=Larimichthys crocea TaxID=215358 RepID=A0ACD3QF96_LARCR|nr:Anoctamin-10 [Larimichthys crocea]
MSPPASPRFFTQREVACHCTKDSCWVLQGTRVYDVTAFLRMHPGGEALILRRSGKDVSQEMEGPPHRHSENARRWMEQYYIGELETDTEQAQRLASLLIVTQLVNQVTEVVIPFLVDRFISAPHRTEHKDDPQEDKFRNQSTLPAFPGLFAEYIELLVQFGYLSLFSCVYPLTAVLLLINNLTEIRSDAYKMCKLFRKPFSPPVANMGVWQIAFEVLSFVSVVSNCWLLLLSPWLQARFQEGGMSSTNILLLAVLVEHVLILVKVILAVLIPDEPDWIRKKREHIEYTSMQALRQQKLQPEES